MPIRTYVVLLQLRSAANIASAVMQRLRMAASAITTAKNLFTRFLRTSLDSVEQSTRSGFFDTECLLQRMICATRDATD